MQLIAKAVERFPARWVGFDAAFGSDSHFLSSLPQGLNYFADIKSNEKVYLEKPKMGIPIHKDKGKAPSKEPVLSNEKTRKVSDIANDEHLEWVTVDLGEGAKGPLMADIARLRVYSSRSDIPSQEPVWLIIRKRTDGQIRYAFSNAPENISLKKLCKASCQRWPIEQCFKEGKSNLGMGNYEHRSWPAWHRHMIYVMLAQHFLLRLRLQFKKKLLV